jgi:hypothetical protein
VSPWEKDPSSPTERASNRGWRKVAPDADLVECLMVVVPEVGSITGLNPALSDLVASRAIRILDLVCVTRSATGQLTVLEVEDVESAWFLPDVDAYASLLSSHDIETASVGLGVGSSAILLLVEDTWAHGLSDAARRAGGRVIGGERVARSRVEVAIAAMERRDRRHHQESAGGG